MIEQKHILRLGRNFNFPILLACVILITTGCSIAGDNPVVQKKIVAEKMTSEPTSSIDEVQLPSGITQYEGSAIKNQQQMKTAQSLVEGYGDKLESHPDIQDKQKVQRTISVPKDVEGKWKAVKLLIKNKTDEEQNQVKTIELGSSFALENLNITVGPFLPSFVMTDLSYTSTTNRLNNPAVHLVIEENGKQVYKGWAFAKFPEMYAFPHERFVIQLMDFVPKYDH